MRSALFSCLLILSCALTARGQVNPRTQIRWPASCNSAGMVYNSQSNTCVALDGMSGQLTPNTQINWPGSCTTPGTVYSLQSNTCVALSGMGGQVIPNTQINWPANCNAPGMVYNSQANACVSTGAAGNPAGTSGQGQMNLGGVFAPIPGLAVDGINGWNIAGGTRYAKGWQTGGGNNGIANAVAAGQTVVADPSYSSTESYVYNFNSFKEAPAVVQAHVIDYRSGTQTDTYRDPPIGSFSAMNAGHITNFQNYLQPSTTFGRPMAEMIYANFLAPGISLGSASPGPTNWTVGVGLSINQLSASPGIHEALGITQYKTGIGDNTGGYFYNYSYGGATAAADEGNHGLGIHGDENTITFKGTVTTGGGGTGATTLKILCTADCNTTSGGPGDGRYVVDQTTVLDSGNFTTYTLPSGQTPGTLTPDHTITASTAIGTLNGNCNVGAAPLPVGTSYNTVTCSVNLVSGAFVAGNSLVCFNGNFHEQALISSISGTGPYNLTMNLRHAHGSTSMIAQGGPCGSFVNFTANDANGVLHFPIDLIGAPDTTHYYYSFFYLGSSVNGNAGSPVGGFGAMLPATQGVTSLTNIGGVVYYNVSINTNYTQIVGTTTYFSSASGGLTGYNGACTNTQYSPSTGQAYCTQASSVGLGTAATATAGWGTSLYGNSAYTVWPGAEVLDVLDHSVNPPVMYNNGVFTLTTEPNNGTWANGDAVEEAHHYALRLGNLMSASSQNKMLGSSFGLSVGIGGPGSCCGNFNPATGFTNSYQALSVNNTGVAASTYKYHGGFVTPPGAMLLSGIFNYGLAMGNAPDPFASPLIYSGCPISGCSDPYYYYYPLMVMGNGNTADGLAFRPNANEMVTVGNWVWQSDFGKQTFRDSATFGALTVPTLSTPTTAATGGNLADATTYFYTVYAANSTGLGLPSTEKSILTGSSGGKNANSLVWTRVSGATSYWVCRSTSSGAELKGPNITNSYNLTYLDNGSATYSGACNATDTSRAGTDNAAYAGIENPNGTTQTKIGPGTATTNITVSLPATAGTLALTTDISGTFPVVQGTNQVVGGTTNFMGNFSNLVLWSADLVHGGAWSSSFASATGAQTDPWGGTTATQLVSNGGGDNYNSFPGTLTASTAYCVSSWMKGAAGGEVVSFIAGGQLGGGGTLTTSWARYSGTITTINTGGAGWHQAGSVATFSIAGLQLTLGACPSALVGYVATGSATVSTSGVQTPILMVAGTSTTVSCSTSGTAIFSQPLQGTTDKKVLVHLAACNGTASYTFPTAYTNTPGIFPSSTVAAGLVTSLTTTATTITGATSTGTIALEDW